MSAEPEPASRVMIDTVRRFATDLEALRHESDTARAQLRRDVDTALSALRTQVDTAIAAMRADIYGSVLQLDQRYTELRNEIKDWRTHENTERVQGQRKTLIVVIVAAVLFALIVLAIAVALVFGRIYVL